MPLKLVCGDCGNFIDEDLGTFGEVEQCPDCNSDYLLMFDFSDDPSYPHRDLGPQNILHLEHFRPMKGLIGKKSTLARLSSAILNLVSRLGLRQLLQPNKQQIRNAPGSTILRLADFFYSPATVEKIFKQEIADWRVEYFEALQRGERRKARWICCRHYWAIAKAVGLDRLVSWFDRVLRRI